MYRTYVSPWVRALATPWTAEMLKWLHPMRTSRYLLSEAFNPWMRGIAALAERVAKIRRPLAQDDPLIEREREAIGEVTQALEKIREARDAVYEQAFSLLFRQPALFEKVMQGMTRITGATPGATSRRATLEISSRALKGVFRPARNCKFLHRSL